MIEKPAGVWAPMKEYSAVGKNTRRAPGEIRLIDGAVLYEVKGIPAGKDHGIQFHITGSYIWSRVLTRASVRSMGTVMGSLISKALDGVIGWFVRQ